MNYTKEKLLYVVNNNDFSLEGKLLGKSNYELVQSLRSFVDSYMINSNGVIESIGNSFDVRLIEYGCMTKKPRRLFSSVIDDIKDNIDDIYIKWKSDIL